MTGDAVISVAGLVLGPVRAAPLCSPMYRDEDDFFGWAPPERPPDPKQADARGELRQFFEGHRDEVFSSRQVEVHFEDRFFHWITNRAIRDLVEEGLLRTESRKLSFGGEVKLVWHRANRFNRRRAKEVVELIDAYSAPSVGGALGLHGEALVLEGFARLRFVLEGREVRSHNGVVWTETEHDVDFIFSRDGHAYGVEVKNTLPYMNLDELRAKIRLCATIGVRPVFAVRMIPATWMKEIQEAGGRYIILKYQLYPWSHRDLAARIERELGLPVKAPRALFEGTMRRFVDWHEQEVCTGQAIPLSAPKKREGEGA